MAHWIDEYLPRVLPPLWSEFSWPDGRAYRQGSSGLTVIVSGRIETDEKRWVHLSVAHKDRMPTWDELVHVKEVVLGRDVDAIQVIPGRGRYVNEHPYCLHVFLCVDGSPLPDFTVGVVGIGDVSL